MKYLLIFIFAFVFIFLPIKCHANDISCAYSDDAINRVEIYCENYTGIRPENCSTSLLYNISKSTGTTELKIGGCAEDIIKRLIKNYPHLESLDISNSEIVFFDSFDMKLVRLEKLNMSHNRLLNIPNDLAKNVQNLTQLYFSNNKLDKLTDLPSNFTYIDLSFNNLSSLYAHNLNVYYNGLKTVRLEGNPIGSFDWKMLSLVESGISVYMSWQQVTEFKIWHSLGKPIHVISNSQEEGVFPNDEQIELHCNVDSFESINRFEFIENDIKNATEMLNCLSSSVEYITLSGQIPLDATPFKRLINLKELNLRNVQLMELDFSLLNELTKLEWLDISHTHLEKLDSIQSLENAKNLIHLNVAENELESTPELIQHLTPSIVYLNLAGNYVGKLNANTFQKFNNMQSLYLSNTSISFDNLSTFEPLKRLQNLDISYNNLDYLELTPHISSLRQLRTFVATNCNIANASQLMKLFEASCLLWKLDLSGNFLGKINAKLFENFAQLRHLNLSKTNLSDFNVDILKYKYQLHLLDLSYNNLETIDFGPVISNLKSLFLQGNYLTEIKYLTQSHLPHLAYLNLLQNQFSCAILSFMYETSFKESWPLLRIDSENVDGYCDDNQYKDENSNQK